MKWIDVNERLPEEHQRVLVAISTAPQEDCWDMAVMYRYQHWCWRGYGREIRDDGHEAEGSVVTHWAPLPAQPRKETS